MEVGPTPHAPAISIVGDLALDLYFDVPDLEGGDEKVTATGGRRELGGTGANAASAAAHLGSPVRLFSSVGNDPVAAWLRHAISGAGVDVEGVATVDGRSTISVILRANAGRTVIVDRGVADDLGHVRVERVEAGASLIYLSAIPGSLVRRFLERARVPVIVGYEPRQLPELLELAPVLDRAAVVITNAAGAADLVPVATPMNRATLVVTQGSAGASILGPGGPWRDIPALEVDAVDATGAGDCFAGSFCHFMAVGEGVVEAVRLATAAASLSTTALGAQGHLPSEDEVRVSAAKPAGGSGYRR